MTRAIRVHEFGEPEVMHLEEVELPEPAPGQVLVRVEAVGVNPVDTYIRSGSYGALPALPYTPGMDGAGTVTTVGPGVTRVAPGDRVYFGGSLSGAYAAASLCRENQVHPLPANVTPSQGAAVHVPCATAWRALFNRGHARAGETVLVHGASGSVGLAAVQLARAAGLQVIGTAGSDRGRELVLQEGAHFAFGHDQDREVLEVTGGRGCDLILEMLANVNLDRDLDLVARGGRVVVIGNRGRLEIDPRKTMTKDSSVLGMSLLNASEQELLDINAGLRAALESGVLRPVVRTELPLDQAPQAHRLVLGAGSAGKIVLLPQG